MSSLILGKSFPMNDIIECSNCSKKFDFDVLLPVYFDGAFYWPAMSGRNVVIDCNDEVYNHPEAFSSYGLPRALCPHCEFLEDIVPATARINAELNKPQRMNEFYAWMLLHREFKMLSEDNGIKPETARFGLCYAVNVLFNNRIISKRTHTNMQVRLNVYKDANKITRTYFFPLSVKEGALERSKLALQFAQDFDRESHKHDERSTEPSVSQE